MCLDQHPQIVDYAMEAINRTGLTAKLCSIRGGTDGSRLIIYGFACPNIFAGEHAFHSRQEWVSVQDMQKAVETILHLCMIWEEIVQTRHKQTVDYKEYTGVHVAYHGRDTLHDFATFEAVLKRFRPF
jgi:hypothetical protein